MAFIMAETTTAVRPFGALDPGSNPSIGIGNHGGWPDSTINYPFHGAIDELKVHDVPLTETEILANFHAQKGDLEPSIAIDDVSVTEGDLSYSFTDAFVSASDGGLTSPRGVAFGPDGNLYVASADTDSILRYDSSSGEFIDAFVPAGSGGLDLPWDIVFHDGDLYVSSNLTNSVLRYNGTTGAFVSEFVGAGSGGLDGPRGLLFGENNELYVTSTKEDDAVCATTLPRAVSRTSSLPVALEDSIIRRPSKSVRMVTSMSPTRMLRITLFCGMTPAGISWMCS